MKEKRQTLRMRISLLIVVAGAVLGLGCGTPSLTAQSVFLSPPGPVTPGSGKLPPELRDVGIDQKLNEQVPLDINFRDEIGRSIKLGDYFGKRPVILSLVYYDCPMLCTLVLNGLVSSLRVLTFDPGKEFEAVTVSFDPRETPALAAAKKQTYMENYRRTGAASSWHFLTGDEAAVRKLTQAVGFRYRFDPSTGQFAHASGIMVLTPEGRVSRYFYGIDYSARDLRLGLVEAAALKIGSPVDQILLFCFHYDPINGKYGWAILNTVRLAGGLTVLALGTFLCLMFYQDSRKKRLTRAESWGYKV